MCLEKSIVKKESAHIQEYCGREGNIKYAGVHLLVEIWQSRFLKDKEHIRATLEKAVEACGVTMLSIDLHVFSPNGGISGVAILQESHISIHTWPEYDYAALDVFVCGTINPKLTIPVLESEFKPGKIEIQVIKRGILS